MELTGWDLKFISMATLVGSWSKDPRTKVGAVIADKRHRVISLGYNGYPYNLEDTIVTAPREEKLLKVIHAEENALLFKNAPVENCIIYTTCPPCPNCTSKILQSGIIEIVTVEASEIHLVSWGSKHMLSLAMMCEAGVKYTEYKRADLEKIILTIPLL